MNRRKFLLGAAATSLVTVAVPSLVLPSRTLAMAEPNRFYSLPGLRPVQTWDFGVAGGENTLLFFTNFSYEPVKLIMIGQCPPEYDSWSMTVSGRGVCALGPLTGNVIARAIGPDVDAEAQFYTPQHIELMRSKPNRGPDPELEWSDWKLRTTNTVSKFKIPRSGV